MTSLNSSARPGWKRYRKISGEVEEKWRWWALKTLDALRGIFHRWTTLKTAEDVKDTVEIPELDEHQQDAPLTEEQLAAYEELRQQAEAVAKANNGVTTSVDEDGVIGARESPSDLSQ